MPSNPTPTRKTPGFAAMLIRAQRRFQAQLQRAPQARQPINPRPLPALA